MHILINSLCFDVCRVYTHIGNDDVGDEWRSWAKRTNRGGGGDQVSNLEEVVVVEEEDFFYKGGQMESCAKTHTCASLYTRGGSDLRTHAI